MSPSRRSGDSNRSDAECLEKLGGGVPVHTGILEIVVIRPDWDVHVEGQREHVDIVRITKADAALGLGQTVLVLGALDYCDRKCGGRQQKRVEVQASLFGERTEVLNDFVVSSSRREHSLDPLVPERESGASADDC